MKIVIEGAGEVGSHLAKMLRAEANEVTVIDDDDARLKVLGTSVDVETVHGSPTSIATLRQANAGKADLFIAVYPFTTQEVNLVSALLAKQLGAGKVVARINDENFLTSENKLLFKEMGLELLFYPEKSAADEIVAALKHSSTSETMDFARGKLQIAVFKLGEEAQMLDLNLGDFIKLVTPEELKNFRIIAVSREEKTLIPKLDTKFLYGDMVFTVSTAEGVPALFKYFGKSNITAKNVMVMGGSAIGEMVARSLAKQGVSVKLVDKDKERCIALSSNLPASVQIVNADGRNFDMLYDEGIHDCDAFIAVTSKDEVNILACVGAKKFGVPRTIAEVENIEYIRMAEEMGVDTIINKKLITAGRIFKFTLSGRARFVRYMAGTKAEVLEYTVAPGSAITKKPLKDLGFPSNAIIGGVIRGSESFIAVGDTLIEPYDRVAIIAMPEAVKEIDKFFK